MNTTFNKTFKKICNCGSLLSSQTTVLQNSLHQLSSRHQSWMRLGLTQKSIESTKQAKEEINCSICLDS